MDFSEKNIKLVELANTWQGEGPNTGRQMLIARFKYCNRFCKMCDTWIKMKTSAEGSYSIDDINKELIKTRGLMITGGEPTFETDSFSNLNSTIQMINNCNCEIVNIETNGCNIEKLLAVIDSNPNNRKASVINVMYSPKIFSESEYHSEIEKTKRVIYSSNVYLKIVADGGQWSERYIRDVANMSISKGKIYLMPLGTTMDEIMKNWEYCINMADELNLNLSTRMHIVNQFT